MCVNCCAERRPVIPNWSDQLDCNSDSTALPEHRGAPVDMLRRGESLHPSTGVCGWEALACAALIGGDMLGVVCKCFNCCAETSPVLPDW
jgi:hypothetical protein